MCCVIFLSLLRCRPPAWGESSTCSLLPSPLRSPLTATGHPPPQDLLHSIHAHTSSLFASKHLILPRLTKDDPFLPPDVVAHLATIHTELVAKEDAALANPATTRAEWDAVRERRGDMSRKEGPWKGVWTDGERAFDASALVAVGESAGSK